MARLARVEVFVSDEIATVHVMNWTVRRCFLLGNDPLTGKNFDHRKTWFEQMNLRVLSCYWERRRTRFQLGELNDIAYANSSESCATLSHDCRSVLRTDSVILNR